MWKINIKRLKTSTCHNQVIHSFFDQVMPDFIPLTQDDVRSRKEERRSRQLFLKCIGVGKT